MDAPGSAHLTDVPQPTPGPDDVLVRVEAVGICGSDLDMAAGTRAPAFCRLPVVLGHEFCGRIAAAGAAVSGERIGTRVAVEGHNYCGVCHSCLRGETQCCARYDEFGFTRNGGYAPFVVARADLCHPLARASAEVGALTEPTACALHAIERVAPTAQDDVVVVGGGPIGLLCVALARHAGARQVIVCDLRRDVARVAEQMGATAVVTGPVADISTSLDARFPDGASVVIEAAGHVDAQALAVRVLARGGRLALLGLAGTHSPPSVSLDALVWRDARVHAVFAYPSAVFRRAAVLLDERAIDPGPILTHRLPLSDVASAFALLRARTGSTVKVTLDPHA